MSEKNNLPWFPFFPDNWLGSPEISMMSSEQEGAYIRLLCYAWGTPDCSLPNDDEVLARLSRRGDAWQIEGKLIKKQFVIRNKKLYNLRLKSEHSKCLARSRKCKDSITKRWKSKKSNGLSGYERNTNELRSNKKSDTNVILSTSTSTSTSTNKENIICSSEHSPDGENSEPVFLTFPCIGQQKEFALTEKKVGEYCVTYETVDVKAECKKMLQWFRDNPDRRKTARGIPRFINTWLCRAVDGKKTNTIGFKKSVDTFSHEANKSWEDRKVEF